MQKFANAKENAWKENAKKETSPEIIIGGPRHKILVPVPKRPDEGRRLQGRENGGNEIKALDPKTFTDPRWQCFYAEQHSSGQFKGNNFYLFIFCLFFLVQDFACEQE